MHLPYNAEHMTNLADWHASAVESVADFVLVLLAFLLTLRNLLILRTKTRNSIHRPSCNLLTPRNWSTLSTYLRKALVEQSNASIPLLLLSSGLVNE